MAETSFPIVGADLTDDAWAATVGAVGNGVLDDWGSPYSMTVNTNDTVTIQPSSSGYARAVVNGFGHQLDDGKTVAVPAVSSTTTYQIGLLYDPTNATLPVSLVVLKGTMPVLTTGQEFLPLHVFKRSSGQTLSGATRYSPMPRIRPQLVVSSTDALQMMSPKLFLCGTEMLCTDKNVTYRAAGSSASPQWVAGPSQGTWQGTRATMNVARGSRTAVLAFSSTVERNAWWMEMTSGSFKLADGHYVITATMRLADHGGGADGRVFLELAPSSSSARSLARSNMPDAETFTSVTWNGYVSASTPLSVWLYQRNPSVDDKPQVTLSVTRIA